jgi:hypothetical protein
LWRAIAEAVRTLFDRDHAGAKPPSDLGRSVADGRR